MLLNVIIEAKQYDYHRHIENSNNKMQTVWNIVKSVTEKMCKNEDIYIYIYTLNITGNTTYDCYFRFFQQPFLNNS